MASEAQIRAVRHRVNQVVAGGLFVQGNVAEVEMGIDLRLGRTAGCLSGEIELSAYPNAGFFERREFREIKIGSADVELDRLSGKIVCSRSGDLGVAPRNVQILENSFAVTELNKRGYRVEG